MRSCAQRPAIASALPRVRTIDAHVSRAAAIKLRLHVM
jgi:hypothetical protein